MTVITPGAQSIGTLASLLDLNIDRTLSSTWGVPRPSRCGPPVKSEHESNGQVRVTVEDSGTGIDPQHVEKVFGSFFTTKVDGIGMGLSICRSIIESPGGRLWASSGRSRGAVFQFTLPSNRSQGETDAVIE